MSKEVAKDLRAAKRLIRTPKKWTQGRMHGDGCYCAWGAVRVVVGLYADDPPESAWERENAALVALRLAEPLRRKVHLIEFNDSRNRTHADIMRLFDDAIAAEEAA